MIKQESYDTFFGFAQNINDFLVIYYAWQLPSLLESVILPTNHPSALKPIDKSSAFYEIRCFLTKIAKFTPINLKVCMNIFRLFFSVKAPKKSVRLGCSFFSVSLLKLRLSLVSSHEIRWTLCFLKFCSQTSLGPKNRSIRVIASWFMLHHWIITKSRDSLFTSWVLVLLLMSSLVLSPLVVAFMTTALSTISNSVLSIFC